MFHVLFPLSLLLACGGGPPSPQTAPDAAIKRATTEATPAKPVAIDAGEAAAQSPTAPKPSGQKVPGPITPDNWTNHPRVLEVRNEVAAVEKALADWRGYTFEDGCGEQGIYEVKLHEVKVSESEHTEGETLTRKFYLVEGKGDVRRETTMYYDLQERALFGFSVYIHASAGSRAISRQYFTDGELVFEAPVELQASDMGGPTDPTPLSELLPPTTIEAFRKMSSIASECEA